MRCAVGGRRRPVCACTLPSLPLLSSLSLSLCVCVCIVMIFEICDFRPVRPSAIQKSRPHG